ncbi:glutathione peroxidase [Dinoroseobacter sp. S375]|uniref:glutathione peroxidase n=1 Tax=Dinoroseobacter sp. S375 TaxID=3415136 RepID=UPI003C7C9806
MVNATVRYGVFGAALSVCLGVASALASPPPEDAGRFMSIDGGPLDLSAWRGRPVLVVNTASHCGFTDQYEGLQALQDRYGAERLVVLAVPSDSFNQELESAAEVAEFCEINYGLDLPMTDITPVRGPDAHPFYSWLQQSEGVAPRWNFTKVLLDGEGGYVAHWGSTTRPLAPRITREIDALLTR